MPTPINNTEFTTTLADIIQRFRDAVITESAAAAELLTLFNNWTYGTTSESQLGAQLASVLGNWQHFVEGQLDWLTVPVDGGPHDNGDVDLVDYLGNTTTIPSLAKLTADLAIATEVVEASEEIFAAATAAQTAATTATTKASEASTSASTASTAATTATTKASEASTSASTASTAAGTAVTNAATTTADRSAVATDKGIVASDKATVAADKATVATDKGIVAADKATTAGYKTAAETAAATATTQGTLATTMAAAAATDADDADAARVLAENAASVVLGGAANLAAGLLDLLPLTVDATTFTVEDTHAGRLLVFRANTRVIVYVDTLDAGFTCGLMKAGLGDVEIRGGLTDVVAPDALTVIETRYESAVLRQVFDGLNVLQGGETALPNLGINRFVFNRAGSSGLLAAAVT